MTYQAPKNGFRTFVILWATQSVSVFGSALTFFAMGIYLPQTLYPAPEQQPQLAFALSAMALCRMLPTVFVAPLAGAWADRHDRKRTMITADLSNGLLTVILMLLMATGSLQMTALLTLTVLMAFCDAFHNASFDTSYAMLVPDEQLPRANGMMQSIWSLAGILSPALAATIIALPVIARQGALGGALGRLLGQLSSGASLAIGIDAATFFCSATVLLFLTIPSPRRQDLGAPGAQPGKSIWADIREGAVYIFHRPPLLWLLGTFAAGNLLSSPIGVFQPLLVKFNLAADWGARGFTFETALAMLGTATGVGGLAAGLAISAWGGLKRHRVFGVLVPMLVAGAVQTVFGLSASLYVSVGTIFVLQGMLPLMNAHSQTIWQTQTPRELQGRVFSVRRLIAQCTGPLGTALAGLTGGAFNPGTVVAVMGAILGLFCLAQLFNPQMLRVEDKEHLDREAAVRAAATGGN
jgi:MFS transporter, DHA3 family, macrolide efflux protein